MSRIPLFLFGFILGVGCFGCANNDSTPSRERDSASVIKPDIGTIRLTHNRTIDSTASAIQNLPDDTSKIDVLYSFALALSKTDTVAAGAYANYLLWLSEETNSDKGRSMGYYLLGRLTEDRNDIESAVAYLKQSAAFAAKANYNDGLLRSYYRVARCYRRLADYYSYNEYLTYLEETATKLNDTLYLSYACEGFGNLYRYLGDYALSVTYYERCIALSDSIGDLEQKSIALNNMSLVYEYESNYQEELRIQLQNYDVIRQAGKESYLVLCLSNLSATYDMLEMRDESEEAIRESMKVASRLPPGTVPDKDLASAYAQYGWISMQRNKMDTALHYYRKAMTISEAIKDRKAVCSNHGRLAEIYLTGKNYDSAGFHLQKKLELATEINFRKGQIDAWAALADLKFRTGDTETAYRFLVQSNLRRDSLQSAANASRAAELETWNKVRLQQQEIQSLSHDKEVQRLEIEKRDTLTYALTGGFVLVLLLAVVIYTSYRRNRMINLELERKVAERTLALTRKNNDLKNFIYRSSHDLRSPLTSIKGLLNIARSDSTDEQVTSHLNKIATVVERQDTTLNALLKLSRLIEGKVAPEEISVSGLLEEICTMRYPSDTERDVQITFTADPRLSFRSDRVIVTSTLLNLIDNGVKFRRRRGAEKCFVSVQAIAKDAGVEFTVRDNGEGIPEEWKSKIFDLFSRGSAAAEGSGLGLYIVMSSVETLGGTLAFDSTFGQGSTFTIWIPDAAPGP